MRLPPTPSPLRQDLSATQLEIPLETHLRSLILRNNPQISTSQLGDSSRPSHGDFTDAAPPTNIPAIPSKGSRAQRNDAPITQGMVYHRFENPQPLQNRPASVSRTNRSQDINNPTGQVALGAYSFTPPPLGLDAQKKYGQRTDGPNNYYRQGRVPPQIRQMNDSNDTPRQQFQGRGGNPNRPVHDHHTARTSQHHLYGRVGGGNRPQWSDNPARDQVNYLQQLAIVEVPNAEMSSEEATKRENLRLHLERLCSETIYQFELKKDKDFDANSVQLKCFGSLSSGFATWSSDMDLALLSPHSVPNSSSRDSEIPRLLEKAFLDLGYGARLLTRTRVPIIKFCEEPTPDLAKSLLDERRKFEQERYAPPKPKPKKIRKGKDTKGGAKDGSKDHSEDGSMDRSIDGPSPAISRESGLESITKAASCSKKNEGSQKTIVSGTKGDAEINTQAEERVDYEANETPVSSAKVDNPKYSTFRRSEAPLAINDDPEGNSNCEAKHQGGPLTSSPLTDSSLINTTTSGTKGTSEDLVNTEENNDSTAFKLPCSQTEDREANCKAKGKTKDATVALVQRDEAEDEDDVFRTDDELVFLYTLAMDEGWYDAKERKIIKEFVTAVKLQASGSGAASLDQARLKLKYLTKILHRYRAPPEHHLDFPKTGVGIQCDINFSNPLALHNTLLLRCYSHSDPRVRPMIIFVKAWAKKRKINSPYHGTLSSYGYVLMVLHYLINVANPPVLLNLQTTKEAVGDRSPHNYEIIDGYTVRFWRSENEIIDLARSGGLVNNTRDNVGSLLRGFFHYYAQQGYYSPRGGFCWPKDVISIRTNGGIITKNEKGWTEAKTITIEPTNADGDAREIRQRYLLAIEDPFEIDHNIARTVVYHGIRAIRDEFQRAHGIVQNVGPGVTNVDLFAEAPDRESLNRRFFGPLPRKGDPEMKNDEKSKMQSSSTDKKSGTDNEKMGLGDLAKGRKGGVGNDKEASSGGQKSSSDNSTDRPCGGAASQEKGPSIQPPKGPRKPSGRRKSKADKLLVSEVPTQPSKKLPPHLRVPLEGSSGQAHKPALQLGLPPGGSSLALPDQVSVAPSRHDLDSISKSSPFPVEGQESAISKSPAYTITGLTARSMSHDSTTTNSPSSLDISSMPEANIGIRTNLSHVYFC